MSCRSALRLGVLLFVAVFIPDAARGIQKPRESDRVLPDFDLRNESPPSPVPETVRDAIARMRRRLPELLVRFDRVTGSVRQLHASHRPLSTPSSEIKRAIGLRFLRTNRDLFGLDDATLDSLVTLRQYASANEQLVHLDLGQVADGIRVFGARLAVHMDRSGRVMSISNSTMPWRRRTAVPALTAEQAIITAAHDVRPELNIVPIRMTGPAGPDRAALFAAGPFRSNIPVRLTFFPAAPEPRLAWHVVVEPAGFPQAYEILIDASTGETLYRRNLVQYSDGVGTIAQSDATRALDARRPDEHPTGSASSGPNDPQDGCPPIAGFASRSLSAPFIDASTVLGSTGRLSGNNSHVFRGSSTQEGALGVTDETGQWRFDFGFNTSGSAETHLFFLANFLHDFFYDLGFDEAAGNFQSDNLGRGGTGGDNLIVVSRANGRNNANFSTPIDGQKPTMNMFLWDGSGCWASDVDSDGASDLDGAYDSDIVIHEFHHGVSNRLNSEFTGAEASAMGEGGGDFFAYSINGNTRLAEYAAPPTGIRQINGKTYGDWLCFFLLFCEPHDNGEIWANTLWDVRERFRADLVGGSEDAGIHDVYQLYIDGLKLSPSSPTMLEMRDAMLLADAIRHPTADPGGSANYCRMWEAFAGRGMGTDARDTKDTGNSTVVADFTMPAPCVSGGTLPAVSVDAAVPQATEHLLSPGVITLTRTGPVDADLIVRFSVSGTATPGADYLALTGSATMVAGNSSVTIPVTPLDDSFVEPDETIIVTLNSGAGYTIGSPTRATVTVVSDDLQPDLIVSALSVSPNVAPGGTMQIADTTSNPGGGAAGASGTRFYLSRNLIVDAADVVLGERSVPPLEPAGASGGVTVVTIPSDTAAGTYYLLARADAGNAVQETQEANNLRLTAVQVGGDLIVSAFSAPSIVEPGSTISVMDTTRNQGAGDLGASVTQFYLSTNFLLDGTDTLIGSRTVPALSAGGASTTSSLVALPTNLTSGSYYLIARADGLDGVAETQETNNTRFASVLIGADLIVSALTGPVSAAPGSSVAFTDATRNQGAAPAQASQTTLYLSNNAVLDASDTSIGSRAVPALAAGAINSGATLATLPAELSTGTYYVFARADAGDSVVEAVETNNTRVTTLMIGPDLVVSLFSAPTSAVSGSGVAITDTTRNQGFGQTMPSVTRFYLSTNLLLDAGDVALGGRAVAGLASGTSSAGTSLVMIPAGLQPATYFLIAKADADGGVSETQENNNLNYRALQVTAPR